MKRTLCSLLVATLPFGSVLADAPKSKNAKVTLVYEHELPNVPGESIKGGGYRLARRIPNPSSSEHGRIVFPQRSPSPADRADVMRG